jgi:HEAT repeat protein
LADVESFSGNDPAAIPVLMELLRDGDAEVRAGAAEALRRIDSQAAAEAGVGDAP